MFRQLIAVTNSRMGVAHTGSGFTRVLGWITLGGFVVVAALGLVSTEPDQIQGDAVRIIYVHVPVAINAYLAFILTAAGSVAWLWKRSVWWDLVAHSAAEIGLLFCGLTLVTGMLWGRPTWGVYWDWGDVRLVTTLILFLIMVGYLAIRSTASSPASSATRAAVVGLIGAANLPIVNQSVNWWANRTLHQQSSLTDGKLEDLTLLSLVLAIVVGVMTVLWLLVHRFRIGWLQRQLAEQGLEEALAERRAEAGQAEQ